ncbi:MAG TPA: hypothetical protein PLH19_02480 [Anaerolineae bacterium]|nr:hypothetical protein [Anaerolineae bacterium]HQH37387.1 hypothetical protein [Anaerolineae bacterium]
MMMKHATHRQWAWGGIWLTLLLILLPLSTLAQEDAPNRAGLIVVHGDGRVLTRCVTFTEERISGVTLLQRSGLPLDANHGPLGSAVCTLNGEGCPAADCFCACQSTPCIYWNYFHRHADGSWAYSGMGAVAWMLGDGDVDAWVWGDGTTLPPDLTLDAICGASSTPSASTLTSSTGVPAATPLPPATTPTATPPPPATLTASPAPTDSPPPPLTPSPTHPVTSSPTHLVTLSPTHPLTYALSFPIVTSPGSTSYRAPSPLRPYIPYVLLLICIVGLALLKRKPK